MDLAKSLPPVSWLSGLPFHDYLLSMTTNSKSSVLGYLNSDHVVSIPSVMTEQPAISRPSPEYNPTELCVQGNIKNDYAVSPKSSISSLLKASLLKFFNCQFVSFQFYINFDNRFGLPWGFRFHQFTKCSLPYYHMPLNKYGCHISHICPTPLLL